jgi:GTPase SAR1 family protein
MAFEGVKTYKIVIAGPTGVGKTFLSRKFKNEIGFGEKKDKEYKPTVGVEIHSTVVDTNRGVITLNIWDTAGDDKFKGLGDGYYLGADVGIVMGNVNKNKELSQFYSNMVNKVGPGKTIAFISSSPGVRDKILTNVSHINIEDEDDVFQVLTAALRAATGYKTLQIKGIIA